ncbi:hypothetical protein TWF696_004873 [Orbilia brochopaga]|uniref:GH16 domain-containing protein n=1 Tax=Orbilia brochopaga TaxID=3140254 RepID=A0AAV9V2A1_9PEZI
MRLETQVLLFTLLIGTGQTLSKPASGARQSNSKLYYRDAPDASASCNCGYYIPESGLTFTHYVNLRPEALSANDLARSLQKQGWTISNRLQKSSPKYINYTTSNIQLSMASQGLKKGYKALQLYVSGGPSNRKNIPGAELGTIIKTIRHGSFRFNVKTSTIPGACHGMFFYKDDNHEIDVEILTSHIHDATSSQDPGPPKAGLQLTVQPLTADQPSKYYKVVPFDKMFDPTSGFHEYRFDWTKSGVRYYVNGKTYSSAAYIPQTAGQILVNNWSNGDPYWSAGPPGKDAILSIGSIDLYFNVTDPTLIRAWDTGCKKSKNKELCGAAKATTT